MRSGLAEIAGFQGARSNQALQLLQTSLSTACLDVLCPQVPLVFGMRWSSQLRAGPTVLSSRRWCTKLTCETASWKKGTHRGQSQPLDMGGQRVP